MTAKRPTADQIAAAAARAGLSLDAADIAEFTGMVGDTVTAYYGAVDRMPDYVPEVAYPRTPGRRPGPDEDPLEAWYVKSRIDGASRGKLKGKTVAIKDNICIAGAADDERRVDAGRLRAQRRRHRGDAHARRRRDHPRQGELRIFLLLGRQPHQRRRDHAQPLQSGAHDRRLVVGLRGAGGVGRGRPGDRQRPGRLGARAQRLLRPGRAEADPRPGALYRRLPGRDDPRPSRADDPDHRRQRAVPGGSRRRRRPRPAPGVAPGDGQGRPLHQGAGPGRAGDEDRRGQGGLRPRRQRGRRRRRGARGRRGVRHARGRGPRDLDPVPPRRHVGVGADRGRGHLRPGLGRQRAWATTGGGSTSPA